MFDSAAIPESESEETSKKCLGVMSSGTQNSQIFYCSFCLEGLILKCDKFGIRVLADKTKTAKKKKKLIN